MVDYTANSKEEKKRPGCLGILLIILLVLGLLSIAAYFMLPKIIVKSASGGFLYKALPQEVRREIDNVSNLITENIGQLEQFGLDSG